MSNGCAVDQSELDKECAILKHRKEVDGITIKRARTLSNIAHVLGGGVIANYEARCNYDYTIELRNGINLDIKEDKQNNEWSLEKVYDASTADVYFAMGNPSYSQEEIDENRHLSIDELYNIIESFSKIKKGSK
jgi:hypothetical protein